MLCCRRAQKICFRARRTFHFVCTYPWGKKRDTKTYQRIILQCRSYARSGIVGTTYRNNIPYIVLYSFSLKLFIQIKEIQNFYYPHNHLHICIFDRWGTLYNKGFNYNNYILPKYNILPQKQQMEQNCTMRLNNGDIIPKRDYPDWSTALFCCHNWDIKDIPNN